MPETVWLIIVASLLGVCGTLAMLAYYDLRNQMKALHGELKSTKLIRRKMVAAILQIELLTHPEYEHAILEVLHPLIENGGS